MSAEVHEDEWKAPYISYQTLATFIDEKLGQNPLPPRIDRGFVDNYAGSVQAQLLSALRTIGLVSEDGAVMPSLREAVKNPEMRQAVIRSWAEEFYKEQLTLAADNATAQMLHESFARHKYSGSTLRKAIVFFLSLVDDLGLPKSAHFKAPRQASPGTARRKKDAKPVDKVQSDAVPPPPPTGEQKTVTLGAAGKVTVLVDVRWLELSDDKFVRLRKAIRDLEELAEPPADDQGPPEGGATVNG